MCYDVEVNIHVHLTFNNFDNLNFFVFFNLKYS